MIRINNIKITEDLSKEDLIKYICKKYKINNLDVINWKISKKSIDARKKDNVHYVFSINITLKNEEKYKKFDKINEYEFPKISVKRKKTLSPIIIGAGPAGLFAALTLVENNIIPIIIEQGKPVEERQKDVINFTQNGILNKNSNIQFGEGGAGTFSDGKLTTGINNPLCKKVLEEFYKFGAPEEILYLSKAHIGTDNLVKIIHNIREYIISKGGKFLFNEKVIDFNIKNNKIKSLIYQNVNNNSTNEIETDSVILSIGHSARDTFEKLYSTNFLMEKKNFSVGVRIEHSQEMINKSQYGTITKLKLPSADYKLSCHFPDGRSCYTFCMCPGGTVMASSSEANTVVTNGMSKFLRDGKNGNSAILVNVVPEDFKDSSVLAGIYFQKELEKKAFELGGNNYYAPIQRVEDYLKNEKSTFIGKIKPTYTPGVTLSNLNNIFPQFVNDTLKKGILNFDSKLKGFANPDAILTGVETRSSSPVRIVRNENFTSNIYGVYPCGEGAGYAGGIMSAAVDGIKCATAILERG